MKISLTILTLMLFFNAHAQVVSLATTTPSTGMPETVIVQEEVSKWEDYFYPDEEFVVTLPEMPIVDWSSEDKLKKRAAETTFGAYSDGIVYVVVAYEARGDGGWLDTRIGEIISTIYPSTRLILKKEMNLGKFPGKQFVIDPDPLGETVWFYGTASRTYMLRAVGAPETHPDVERFIRSLKLTNKPAGKKIERNLPIIMATPSINKDGAGTRATLRQNEVTRKAVLILKPSPGFTEAARQNNVAGTVRLQGVLASSGKVQDIRVVRPLPAGLTEKAITAFSKVKFIPAMKDGRRVSQYVTIEYNFNIY